METGTYNQNRSQQYETTGVQATAALKYNEGSHNGKRREIDIPLQGADLSIVRGGFLIESLLTQDPQTIYFDNIRFE